jgi:hypothetical protein
MNELDLISGLQSHMEAALPVPVKTSGLEDERPVPLLLIDDWDTTELNLNNSARSGEATGDFSGDGTVTHEWYLTFNFRTRVEFLVRTADEVETIRKKDAAKHELRLLRENPQSFHNGLKKVELAAGGNPTYEFTEPKEAELMLSARFHGDHTVTRTPADRQEDALAQVKNNFTFNP